MASRSTYNGPRRKLVLGFNIGTTYSDVSYSVLDPGQVPQIKGVTRFPGSEDISDASKIPTIIYYDGSGRVQAVGAEAMREGIYEQAEDEQWVKAEWFKLHLRSRVGPGAGRDITAEIPPLPLSMTAVEVFADFLTYVFECVSRYIQDTHVNGVALWRSVKDHIDFVLSYPNGWKGAPQSEMRKAAVLSGLIPDTTAGHARMFFVSEAEANLHFAIQNGLLDGAMQNGEGVVIVDAREGTIEINSYSRNTLGLKPMFEEVGAPQCHFHGSTFVTIHARQFLENYLAESLFAADIEHITRCFDKTTKIRFRSAEEPQYVKFGSTRDNDPSCNIRFGQLKLQGTDVALFFEPSIDCIVKGVMDQKNTTPKLISHVVLVGNFAASNYLFNKVHTALVPAGLNVLRPENNTNKAISDGVISFYLGHFIVAQDSDKAEMGLIAENQRLRDELKKAEGEIRALRHTNRKFQRTQYELKKVEVENQSSRNSNHEVDQEHIHHRENVTALRNELANVKKDHYDSRMRSEIQSDGLVTAQDYVNNADLLSISDLRQKVSNLNDSNYSMAAWFGGALVHAQRRRMSEEESQAAYQVTSTMIGEPAAMILVANASKTELDPFVVQLVMQIYLAKFCSTKIGHWYEGGQETDDFLKTIYGEIKHHEQAMSGRWRAITRAYSRPSTNNWTNDFTSRLKYIMKIASWELTSPEIQNALEQKLKLVFNAILDVRLALGEQFTSADFEVFCLPGGAPFDPQCMEDALFDRKRMQEDFGDGSDAGGGSGSHSTETVVIGTTGLGLREVPRRGTRSSSHIVLLAKVIL